jgi:pimeloyl-ACP methyl ester carboxylesterase
VVTALWFVLAWIYRSPRPRDAQIGVAQTIRLFVEEWITLCGSALRMGIGWWFMREPSPNPAAAPVLLVHGVLCNAGVWLGMRGALRRQGLGPSYTISLGPPLTSIDVFAEELAQRVDRILADTGAHRVTLIGHSMGGLVSRAYLRAHGADRVAMLVTIGSPHHGSVHAHLFPGRSLAEMRPGSDWLRDLNAAPQPRLPIVSIWSWHDSMVAPQTSSRLPGARDIALHGIGHNALLRNREVLRHVCDALHSAQEANRAGDAERSAVDRAV